MPGEKKESHRQFGEGVERFRKIYSDRKKFVAEECSNEAVEIAVAVSNGFKFKHEDREANQFDAFSFEYCKSAAQRAQGIAESFVWEIEAVNFKTIGHYRELTEKISERITALRQSIQEHYGDIPRDFRHDQPTILSDSAPPSIFNDSPSLTVVSDSSTRKKFSGELLRTYDEAHSSLLKEIRRSEDGLINPDRVRWVAKSFDDTLREDSIFFEALLKDLKNGVIKNKKQLNEAIELMFRDAQDVALTAERRVTEIFFKKRDARIKQPPVEGEKEVEQPPEYLEVLGITLNEYFSSPDFDVLIKQRYRAAMMANHPDTAGRDAKSAKEKTEITKNINVANDVLSNPTKRDNYMAYWEKHRKK